MILASLLFFLICSGLEVKAVGNRSDSSIEVRLSDFLPLNGGILKFLATNTSTVDKNTIDIPKYFRKIYDDKVFTVNLTVCDQLQAHLRQGNENQTQNFYNDGELLTRQLMECKTGWSYFSSFVVEKCLISGNGTQSCFSEPFERIKDQIIKTKISTFISIEFFKAKCPNDDDFTLVKDDIERFLDGYASSLNEMDIDAEIKEMLSKVKCNSGREVSRIQKRYLIPALLPIAELTFYIFWKSVFVALYYLSITSMMKWKFKYQSFKNQKLAHDLNESTNDSNCRGKYYWGSCGVPGTHYARECPEGGSLVFEESCSKFMGYLPGSLMCTTNGNLDKRIELPISHKDDSVTPVYETSRERRQNLRYHALGLSKFMCRSLCVKLDENECTDNNKK